MLSRKSKTVQNTKAKRMLWLCFEIGIGLLVVWSCLYLAEHSRLQFPIKWLGFGVSTVVLFSYPIYWSRREWASRSFWLYWLSFLCLHLIVIGLLVDRAYRIPLILFVITTIIEAALINPALIRIQMRENIKNLPNTRPG